MRRRFELPWTHPSRPTHCESYHRHARTVVPLRLNGKYSPDDSAGVVAASKSVLFFTMSQRKNTGSASVKCPDHLSGRTGHRGSAHENAGVKALDFLDKSEKEEVQLVGYESKSREKHTESEEERLFLTTEQRCRWSHTPLIPLQVRAPPLLSSFSLTASSPSPSGGCPRPLSRFCTESMKNALSNRPCGPSLAPPP